jgi:hypothetical protein
VLEEVERFTYLSSIVDKQGGTDADVMIRVGKARAAFLQLKKVWISRYLSTNTKIRLFNSNIKSVLQIETPGKEKEGQATKHLA